MPVQILRPNFVDDADALGIHREIDAPTPSAAAFVGDQNVLWRDGDSGTYADLVSTHDVEDFVVTETRLDRAVGLMDALSVDSTQATLNSVRVELWASHLTGDHPSGNPTANMDLIDTTSWDDDFGFVYKWRSTGFVDTGNPSPWDVTYPADSWGFNFYDGIGDHTRSSAEMLDFLASGNVRAIANVSDIATVDGSWTVAGRVLDYKLTVDYTLKRRPIQRIHPRGDGARIFPSQATNRLAGGYV